MRTFTSADVQQGGGWQPEEPEENWQQKALDFGLYTLGGVPAAYELARGAATWLPGKAVGAIGAALGQDPQLVEEWFGQWAAPSAEKIAGMAGGMPEEMERGFEDAMAPVETAMKYGLAPARKAGELVGKAAGEDVGYAAEFLAELATFKLAHTTGKAGTKRVKRLRSKLLKQKEAVDRGKPVPPQAKLGEKDKELLGEIKDEAVKGKYPVRPVRPTKVYKPGRPEGLEALESILKETRPKKPIQPVSEPAEPAPGLKVEAEPKVRSINEQTVEQGYRDPISGEIVTDLRVKEPYKAKFPAGQKLPGRKAVVKKGKVPRIKTERTPAGEPMHEVRDVYAIEGFSKESGQWREVNWYDSLEEAKKDLTRLKKVEKGIKPVEPTQLRSKIEQSAERAKTKNEGTPAVKSSTALSREAAVWKDTIEKARDDAELASFIEMMPKDVKRELRSTLDKRLQREREQRVEQETKALERGPDYMKELEGRLREAAKGNDLEKIRERVDEIYQEVARTSGYQEPGQVDLALEMASEVRERVVNAQRVKRLRETDRPMSRQVRLPEEAKAKRKKISKEEGLKRLKDRAAKLREKLGDETGAIDIRTISKEKREAIERAVKACREAGERFEDFVRRGGFSTAALEAMKQAAKEMDRDRTKLAEAPKATGRVVKRSKGAKLSDGTQLYKPEVYDYEKAALENATDSLAGRPIREHIGTMIRIFEDAGSAFKAIFYDAFDDANGAAARELKRFSKEVKELKKGLSHRGRKQLETWAFQNQRDGLQVLRSIGLKPLETSLHELNPKAFATYQKMRAKFDEFYERVNKARIASGEAPFRYKENYFTFLWDMAELQRQGIVDWHDTRERIERQINQHRAQMSFKSAKSRAEGLERKLVTDPFEILNNYGRGAIDYIHKAPVVAKISEMLGKFPDGFSLKDQAPHLHRGVTEWRDFVAGKDPYSFIPKSMRPAARWLRRNLVWSIMSWNVRSWLVQMSALGQAGAIIGGRGLLEGAGTFIGSAKAGNGMWEYMMKHSNHMPARIQSFDVTAREALGWGPGKQKRALRKAWRGFERTKEVGGKAGMVPLQVLDLTSASITWFGAYKKGMRELGSEKAALRYADDMVVETQGSAMKHDIAKIQRSEHGKMLTLFQTFALNNWDLIVHDILGYKNPGLKTKERRARALRYLLGTAAINYVYYNMIRVDSPQPDPYNEFKDTYEKTGDLLKAARAAGVEAIEPFPLAGGVAKYGGSLGGAVMDTIEQALNPDSTRQWYAAMFKLVGMPGVSQAKKSARQIREKGSATEVITGGRYQTPKRKKKPSKRSGGLGGFGKF